MPADRGRHMFRFIVPSYHRIRGASSMKDAAALDAKAREGSMPGTQRVGVDAECGGRHLRGGANA